ncbi:hypothetical protein RFI_16091 [Reticulomyxa filosa]|uniref:Uncharacterized protein n=1 Tax=Reticulomyxa filosa TaxID=46433 RepID=X6N4Z8_RETFI|nr:hypothetical protein RFI_16091 [Reticulomyxa filosa]|eukprot:ETO21116.1 hypothetical protein RFI_16091 [Reticulomyxa filosa]
MLKWHDLPRPPQSNETSASEAMTATEEDGTKQHTITSREAVVLQLLSRLQRLESNQLRLAPQELERYPELKDTEVSRNSDIFLQAVHESKAKFWSRYSAQEFLQWKRNDLLEVNFIRCANYMTLHTQICIFVNLLNRAQSHILLEEFRVIASFREKEIALEHLNAVIIPIGYKRYYLRPGLHADGTSNLDEWSIHCDVKFNSLSTVLWDSMQKYRKILKYYSLRKEALKTKQKSELFPYAYQFLDHDTLKKSKLLFRHYRIYHAKEIEREMQKIKQQQQENIKKSDLQDKINLAKQKQNL